MKWHAWEGRPSQEGGWGFEKFPFHTEESLRSSAPEVCAETRTKDQAISCHSERGPNFCGFHVWDRCNSSADSFTGLGIGYVNDTGIAGDVFFTGSRHFKVAEIEVFEIID
jgi:hypothetical protein